jgi:hypothetical protein
MVSGRLTASRSRLDEAFERDEPKQPSVRWSGVLRTKREARWRPFEDRFIESDYE